MVLLRLGRVHAYRHLLRSGQLRAEHRRLAEYRDPALADLQNRPLTPPFDRNLGRVGRDSRGLLRFERHGVRAEHEDRDRVFRRLERRTGEGRHLRHLLVVRPAARDGALLEAGSVLEHVRHARLPIPGPRVAVAELHAEGPGQLAGRAGKRHVIRDQEERSALLDPGANGGDLIRREGGRRGERPILGVSLVERVGDHEDVHCLQRGRGQRIAEAVHAVAVAPQELGERLIAPVGRMEIVVRLVDRDAGTLARFVGRPGNGRVVLQVGHLLGLNGARGRQQEDAGEQESLDHVTSLSSRCFPPCVIHRGAQEI